MRAAIERGLPGLSWQAGNLAAGASNCLFAAAGLLQELLSSQHNG
jgi:hypothetical protein